METLTNIVRQLRDLGMTQEDVAAELELSQAYISGIERGKRGTRTPADTLDRASAVRDRLLQESGAVKQ